MGERTYTVYCHTNNLNGKKYFGITCQRLVKRFQNGGGYKGCTHFYRAIQEYGWSNFSHDVIATGLSAEDAKELEIKLIAENKSYLREFGYNISRGGDGETKYATPEESHEAYKQHMREYYKNNREKVKERNREYRRKHPDYNKNHYAKHKEEYHNRYLAISTPERKERLRQYTIQYRMENPEKVKASQRAYKEKHREEHKAYMREYHKRCKGVDGINGTNQSSLQ